MLKSIITRLRFQTIGQLVILGIILLLFVYGQIQLSTLSRLNNDTLITSDITKKLYEYNRSKDSTALQEALKAVDGFSYINQEKEEKYILSIKKSIFQMDSLKKKSNHNRLVVKTLTSNSIRQSNFFILQTSKRLGDINERENVTNLERAVLVDANLNINLNHQITELYLQLGEPGIADSLTDLINLSIVNARKDIKRLRRTKFAKLPQIALKSILRLKGILTVENANLLKVRKSEQNVVNQNSLLIAEMQHDNKLELTNSLTGFSLIRLILLLLILLFGLIMVFFSHYLNKNLNQHIKLSLEAYDNLSKGKYEIQKLEQFSANKDEIGLLAQGLLKLIKGIKLNREKTAKSVAIIRQTSEDLDTASENLSQNTSEEAASMEENSSAIEEMTANLEAVAVNAGDVQKSVEQTNGKVQIITKVVESTGVSLKNSMAKSLIIKDISHKVDILSINAAIEAARAGNAGLGFSVIAEEIRKLSDLVQLSATEIEELAIKGQKHANQSIAVAQGFVPEMKAVVDKMNDLIISIDEIKSGAGQISSTTTQLNSSTQANAQLAEELTQKATQVKSLAEELKFGEELLKGEDTVLFATKDNTNGDLAKSEDTADEKSKEIKPISEIKPKDDFRLQDDISDSDFEKF